MRRYGILAIAAVGIGALALLLGCGNDQNRPEGYSEIGARLDKVRRDLDGIRESDTLRAITTYSSTSYFIYRGQPMGYEYELLTRLAEHMDLELDLVIAEDLDKMEEMLHEGVGDIIAHGLTITSDRRERIAFTRPHIRTTQALVQRMPDNWREMKRHEIEAELVRDPIDLLGKTVHVRENSSYYQRLLNIEEETGSDIDIVLAAGEHETEELIKMVAEGDIDYTVADRHLARINQTYYDNIDVATNISYEQEIAWAVRHTSPNLLAKVNMWLDTMQQKDEYYVIFNKYFRNKKAFKRRVQSEFFSLTGHRISRFDSLIQVYADSVDWDWRLLASMIYQESQFKPRVTSWAGAKGLMQMMPAIAQKFGVAKLTTPELSMKAGTRYIRYLQEEFEGIDDEDERLKFVLASYNVGENHIADARRLAEKYGDDPDVWTGHVEEFILKKSDPEYYNDEVVYYGYCRGEEPYEYVRNILDRYKHYQKFIQAEP